MLGYKTERLGEDMLAKEIMRKRVIITREGEICGIVISLDIVSPEIFCRVRAAFLHERPSAGAVSLPGITNGRSRARTGSSRNPS
jgi:hypothetical protein